MPRGGVDFEGVGVERATFKLQDTITVDDEGKAVAMNANDEVGLGTDGDILIGKLIKVEGDGYGTVAFKGFLKFPVADGSEPTRGKKVVVDGAGNVKDAPEQAVDESGSLTYTIVEKGRGVVVSVDTTNDYAWVVL